MTKQPPHDPFRQRSSTPPAVGAPYGVRPPVDPLAPYGRDPRGVPYSDKSKVAAGLLQILIGGLGIGRFYLGNTLIGACQLGATLVGVVFYVLGFVASFGAVIAAPVASPSTAGVGFAGFFLVMTACLLLAMAGVVWTLVDGILILCDKVPDAQGRPLRT